MVQIIQMSIDKDYKNEDIVAVTFEDSINSLKHIQYMSVSEAAKLHIAQTLQLNVIKKDSGLIFTTYLSPHS